MFCYHVLHVYCLMKEVYRFFYNNDKSYCFPIQEIYDSADKYVWRKSQSRQGVNSKLPGEARLECNSILSDDPVDPHDLFSNMRCV